MKMTKTIKDVSTSSSTQLDALAEACIRKYEPKTHPTRTNRLTRIMSRIILAVVATLSLQAAVSAATFTVTNTNDSGPGSLRQAIADAGSNPGHDLIAFNIPLIDPNCNVLTGVCTIRPLSRLDTIFGPATIDGYTQPNASPNTLAQGTNAALKIELDGNNQQFRGIGGFQSVTIRGLIINRFREGGIGLEGDGNVVAGNFVGTDATGTIALPNNGDSFRTAVFADYANGTVIGGSQRADRNLISGNAVDAILIVNNTGSFFSSNANQIVNNLIGTKADGISPLGNAGDGIRIATGTDHVIANNVIAFNGRIGVNIALGGFTPTTPIRNRVLSNSIHSNGNMGINLGHHQGGVALNDACDGDGDSNNLQNYPVITSAASSGGNYSIDGFLNSNAGGTFTIQFFANDACDASGNGEGKTFLGEIAVTDSNSDCIMNFSATLPVPVGAGLVITSTATDSAGNTSEFSSCSTAIPSADSDGDGVTDAADNCPTTVNPDQLNTDGDVQGDACDPDDDNDLDPDVTDCAPLNASISHSAAEVCDGVDNNCDGQIDEGVTTTFYQDADGDGYGNAGATQQACSQPPGYVTNSDDCNDSNDSVHPDATEICDGLDNDCDGSIDEGFTNTDADGQADCVDTDDDNDGVSDANDNCPLNANSAQTDTDNDGQGDACDADDDNDGVLDNLDQCPGTPTGTQVNATGCPDADGDGVADTGDNCPNDPNPDQANSDGDAQGNTCDSDDDNDSFSDAVENAAGSDPLNANSTPEVCDGVDNDLNEGVDEGFPNLDGDGQANCVDLDDDNDGQTDADETACGSNPLNGASKSLDTDGDNQPNCVDLDDDNDTVPDLFDNCPLIPNPMQADTDHDGIGDACDTPVLFNICTLYDQEKAHKGGSTIPIKLRLCDGAGQNLSSPAIVVTAIGIRKISDSAYGPVEDSGSANPDYNFRYDGTLGGTGGGYIFNLSTKGLGTGTYLLGFTVGSDPTVYTVQFKLK